jgi:HicB-like protein involved in pilus formation
MTDGDPYLQWCEERDDYERRKTETRTAAPCQMIDLEELPGMADTPLETRMITVRLSPEFHAALKDEAYRVRLSMNRLCKLKLAAAIGGCAVPAEWSE